MKTSISIVLSIVILVSFQSILSDKSVEKVGFYEKTDQINIKCNDPNSIFTFREIIYGFPTENCSTANINDIYSQNRTECLINTKFWSLMKYDQPQKCSGNNVCMFQTTWETNDRSTSQCQNATRNSCFLIVKGECLYEEKKIDFCEGKNISGSKIYIHNPNFPSFDNPSVDYECDCAVKSLEPLKLDVIVFAFNFTSSKNCSSSLEIYNETTSSNFTCGSQMFSQSISIPDSRRINLKLTKRQPNEAYQIWLKIQSVEYEQVTVECKKRKYFGTPMTESTTFQTTTGVPFKEIISKADQERMNDFMLGVKIASGVVAGMIVLTLIFITIHTYRRYSNMSTQNKNSTKPPEDKENLY